VTLTRTQTDFEVEGKNKFEAAYKIVIKNAKKTAEIIRIEELFPGEWELKKSNHKPSEKLENKSIWKINIPAGAEKTLTYRVDVRTR